MSHIWRDVQECLETDLRRVGKRQTCLDTVESRHGTRLEEVTYLANNLANFLEIGTFGHVGSS